MDFNENKPIYLQIADRIMDDIERAELDAGARLPSVREYAENVGVNPNTMMRTYNWLQNKGLIEMKRGIGYFVTSSAREEVAEMLRKDFFQNEAPYFFRRLAAFGISPDELRSDYLDYLKIIKE